MNNNEIRAKSRARVQSFQIRLGEFYEWVAMIVPLLAPLVTAILMTLAAAEHYPRIIHIPLWGIWGLASIIGIVSEMYGATALDTMFSMKEYNSRGGQPKAPFEYAALNVGIYILVALVLVIVLKIYPQFALWSLIPVTLMGFLATWMAVLRKQHQERLHDVQTEKGHTESNTELEERVSAVESLYKDMGELAQRITKLEQENLRDAPKKETKKRTPPSSLLGDLNERQREMAQYIHDNGRPSFDVLADKFDVSKSTVSSDMNKLEKAGVLNGYSKMNGYSKKGVS